MKKISLLFLMLLAYGVNATAQSIPVPGDVMDDMLDWIDREPIAWPDGTYSYSSEFDILIWNQDLDGNFVANDYPGWAAQSQAEQNGETLEYTIIDPDKMSFSIYTDYDQIFVFDPSEYTEFDVPTSVVPYSIFYGPDGDSSSTYPHFAWGCIHFASQTNLVENIPGKEPFFTWRIGVQIHYTDNGETTHSNIVYLEVFPKPVKIGDVNDDGIIDITDITLLIAYVLTGESDPPINLVNANVDDSDDIINIADITNLINYVLTH